VTAARRSCVIASSIAAAHERLAPLVRHELLDHLVDQIPDEWLPDDAVVGDARLQRAAYVTYLNARLDAAPFVAPAERARITAAA